MLFLNVHLGIYSRYFITAYRLIVCLYTHTALQTTFAHNLYVLGFYLTLLQGRMPRGWGRGEDVKRTIKVFCVGWYTTNERRINCV